MINNVTLYLMRKKHPVVLVFCNYVRRSLMPLSVLHSIFLC
uniref:Uncharacterized protein n=1 Tax=Rhizophora mucronata TaxID=61149 RepID=A0A2P2P6F3_RHIMU